MIFVVKNKVDTENTFMCISLIGANCCLNLAKRYPAATFPRGMMMGGLMRSIC